MAKNSKVVTRPYIANRFVSSLLEEDKELVQSKKTTVKVVLLNNESFLVDHSYSEFIRRAYEKSLQSKQVGFDLDGLDLVQKRIITIVNSVSSTLKKTKTIKNRLDYFPVLLFKSSDVGFDQESKTLVLNYPDGSFKVPIFHSTGIRDQVRHVIDMDKPASEFCYAGYSVLNNSVVFLSSDLNVSSAVVESSPCALTLPALRRV